MSLSHFETTTAAQVQLSKIGSLPGNSVQILYWIKVYNSNDEKDIKIKEKYNSTSTVLHPNLHDCFKPTTVYDKQKIVSISLDSIQKMYCELGLKEGTTIHK